MRIKPVLQRILQSVLGFKTYLLLFSIYRIKRINSYEPGFNTFLDMIPNEGAILDVGANIGITAVPLASKFNQATVYAFEPIADNFQALTRVIQFFKIRNIVTQKCAVGEAPGTLRMILPVESGVKKQGLGKIDDNHTAGITEQVPVIRLDSLDFAGPVAAIKIDVEGHELEVLKGAKALLLTNAPVIYCELWNNAKRVEAITYMATLGYGVSVLNEVANVLEPYNQQPADNFFFMKPAGIAGNGH